MINYRFVRIISCLGLLLWSFYSWADFSSANEDVVFKRGLYLDADLGVSDADYQTVVLMGPYQFSSVNQIGLAPRFALGYDLIRYLGVELGVSYFARPQFFGYGPTDTEPTVKHNLVHLLLKVSWPLAKWDITARGGVGYVVRAGITGDTGTYQFTALQSGQFFCPVYGLSVDRRFSVHWGIEAIWLQGAAEPASQLPVSNFYGIGTFYKF